MSYIFFSCNFSCRYIIFIYFYYLYWLFELCFRFHTFNAARVSETVPPGSDIPDEQLYARPPPDSRSPRGWLVDLINRLINDTNNLFIFYTLCTIYLTLFFFLQIWQS